VAVVDSSVEVGLRCVRTIMPTHNMSSALSPVPVRDMRKVTIERPRLKRREALVDQVSLDSKMPNALPSGSNATAKAPIFGIGVFGTMILPPRF
jgi:hypothetical protein